MTLRTDRLAALTGALADTIETTPPEAVWMALPDRLRAPVQLACRLARVDLPGAVLTTASAFLRRLPDRMAADPAAADAWIAWAVHVLAWLDDQTDAPPPPPPVEVAGLLLP